MKILLQHKGSYMRSTQQWFTPNDVSMGLRSTAGQGGEGSVRHGSGCNGRAKFQSTLDSTLVALQNKKAVTE
jgi:hypothetical protein